MSCGPEKNILIKRCLEEDSSPPSTSNAHKDHDRSLGHTNFNVRTSNSSTKSVLQTLQLDHQYLSTTGEPGSNSFDSCTSHVCDLKPRTKHLYSILTGSAEFAEKRLERAFEILNSDSKRAETERHDSEPFNNIPNAAAIQHNFQDILMMTSFRPIADIESNNCGQVQGTSDHDGNEEEKDDTESEDEEEIKSTVNAFYQTATLVSKPEVQSRKCQHSTTNELCTNNKLDFNMFTGDAPFAESVANDQWMKIRRTVQDETEVNILQEYAIELMLNRWGQYLSLSSEELRKIELENAKTLNSAPEVIEMLEDQDRYVWQLIDEL